MILSHWKDSVEFSLMPKDLVAEIQQCLIAGNYLQKGDDSGIADSKSTAALLEFKKDVWLGDGDKVGETTAKALLELKKRRVATFESSPWREKRVQIPGGLIVSESDLISPYLSWGEATKGLTRIPTEKWEIENALRLGIAFTDLREKFGSALIITSGYRPASVNKQVGGASRSQHIFFRALDFYPENKDFAKLWQCLKASSLFTGLGDGVSTGKGFYHADIRDGQRIIFGY